MIRPSDMAIVAAFWEFGDTKIMGGPQTATGAYGWMMRRARAIDAEVRDAITGAVAMTPATAPKGVSMQYVRGWNDCLAAVFAAQHNEGNGE